MSNLPTWQVDDIVCSCVKTQAGAAAHRVWESVRKYYGLYRTTSITLPAATITEEGMQIIEELPDEPTRVYSHVGDFVY